MGDLSHRFEITTHGPSPGGPEAGGVVARMVRAVVGGVVLTATVVTGALMGGVILIAAGVLAVGGLAAGLYLRWKLRRMIRDQMRMGGKSKPGDPFTFSGEMAGGRMRVFVQESSPATAAPPPAEEPIDVEILENDEP